VTVRLYAAQLLWTSLLCAFFTDAAADLGFAIAACDSTVVRGEDSSQILIGESCPDLVEEIESSPWAETLSPDWREALSHAELSQLEYFVSYYDRRSFARRELSLSSLDEIVRGLGDAAEIINDKSLWERFVDWFDELLSDKSDDAPGWFSEWLSNVEVSSLTIKIVFWIMSALLVAAAIGVIVMEIRAARSSLPANRLRNKASRGDTGIGVGDRLLTLYDLDNAALDDKPSILLRLVLQRLEFLGVIPYDPARTHREVERAASALGSDGQEVVTRVSESAERIRFSRDENRPQEIGEVVTAGTALLGKLKPGPA